MTKNQQVADLAAKNSTRDLIVRIMQLDELIKDKEMGAYCRDRLNQLRSDAVAALIEKQRNSMEREQPS